MKYLGTCPIEWKLQKNLTPDAEEPTWEDVPNTQTYFRSELYKLKSQTEKKEFGKFYRQGPDYQKYYRIVSVKPESVIPV